MLEYVSYLKFNVTMRAIIRKSRNKMEEVTLYYYRDFENVFHENMSAHIAYIQKILEQRFALLLGRQTLYPTAQCQYLNEYNVVEIKEVAVTLASSRKIWPAGEVAMETCLKHMTAQQFKDFFLVPLDKLPQL